jgi:methionine sulfoxide reductase heme-binding subunit
MSHGDRVVSWTPFKKRFDAWMLAGVAVFLLSFVLVASLVPPTGESFTPFQILIRATGTLAFLLLTFLLCIGPLAPLMPRFKPLLYNRRHLGVTTFLVALVHSVLVVVWYHGFGVLNPIVSLLVSNPRHDSLAGFPFESLGLVALLLLFLLAATSHDFWNANLGPGLWKGIHMSVYAAYALLLGHVALGALQTETTVLYVVALLSAASAVAGLQVYTACFASGDPARPEPGSQGWLRVGPALDIPDSRAIVVEPAGAEGRIIDGCITCPWHGYQYRPEDGCSPAPFTERVATYATRVTHEIVFVHPRHLKPGTPVVPFVIDGDQEEQHGKP